jgi:hypothetical protein
VPDRAANRSRAWPRTDNTGGDAGECDSRACVRGQDTGIFGGGKNEKSVLGRWSISTSSWPTRANLPLLVTGHSRSDGAESLRDLARSPRAGRSVKAREVIEMAGKWPDHLADLPTGPCFWPRRLGFEARFSVRKRGLWARRSNSSFGSPGGTGANRRMGARPLSDNQRGNPEGEPGNLPRGTLVPAPSRSHSNCKSETQTPRQLECHERSRLGKPICRSWRK